ELRKKLLGRALEGLKAVAREADTDAAIDRATAWVHLEFGDIFLNIEAGGTAEAKKQYEQAHDLARRLCEANPKSAEAQRDLSVTLEKLGDVYLKLGDKEAALKKYNEDREICQCLADADKNSPQAQHDLSASHNRLGNVYLER